LSDASPSQSLRDALVNPISGDSPVGDDLRFDVSPSSIYFRLRDARANAREAERLADDDPELRGAIPAQWNVVHDLALEALSSRSKDIEIACWLTESLTRRQGLVGLAEGADVIIGLISSFWNDGLFPLAEVDDPEARLIAITGMSGLDKDGSLLQPLRKLVLFSRPDGTPVTLWDLERARDVAAIGARSGKAPRTTEVMPFADLEAEARSVGKKSLAAVGRDVRRAQASWILLEETISRVVPSQASPSTGRLRALLDTLRQLVERYIPAGEFLSSEAQEQLPSDQAVDGQEPAAIETTKLDRAPPQRRDALLEDILKIAAVFRENEPNSPLSFALEEAVRRAKLPWPELLRELLPDITTRSAVQTVAGMRAPTE
jgi:type VI secretion system protein ImpA